MQNCKQQSELITVIPLTLFPDSLLTKLTPLTNILDVDTITKLANNIDKLAKLSRVQVANPEASAKESCRLKIKSLTRIQCSSHVTR